MKLFYAHPKMRDTELMRKSAAANCTATDSVIASTVATLKHRPMTITNIEIF